MEARLKKYREVSPERAKVWTEKSPKYKQNRKVGVVYYLCTNRQLHHPHFMQLLVSSPKGLYLRDVTNRLDAMRGKGLSSLYSWSSKRSYKNGFVWHDLCEDDLILPVNGNEYVLKGSELFEESNSDHLSPAGNVKIKNVRQLPEQASFTYRDDSSSSSTNGKDSKHSPDDFSPPIPRPSSSDVSPDTRVEKTSSSAGSLTSSEYKIYNNDDSADASTQTEKSSGRHKARETCTRSVSTDDCSFKPASSQNQHGDFPVENSPPPSSSSASSSGGKTETLKSLIRADASNMNSFRILEEEDIRMIPNAKLKATGVLMQLISCGSISVKANRFGLIPTYKPRFNHSKYQSTSLAPGEIDCLLEKPRLTGLRLEDKEKGDGVTDNAVKRSSSCIADRVSSGCGIRIQSKA